MRITSDGWGLLITSEKKMRLASYLDSQQSRKTAAVIVKRGRPLGLILFMVGLVFLYMLPKDEFNRKSFFDENALMAGLAKREFRNQNSIGSFAKGFQNIKHRNGESLHWLESQFAKLGLETYSQNFTVTRPVSFRTESSQVSGANVYAILRAGRARSTEAIVLSAPHPNQTGLDSNDYGIALVLALAEYFRTKTYWAKDLVFLVTTHGELGMQAWIDAHMGLQTANIAAAPLAGRSGSIQAVINLELPTATVQHADVVIEGVNGILPNLDLVNVITHLCESEGIPTAFHIQWELLSHQARLPQPNRHHHALWTVLAIAAHQAPGLPLANHGLFLRHRIDSLTVRGVSTFAAARSISLVNLARALEGTFRSVNNLLETLHHSEFFYYTSSRRRFISIGLYMPPLGLLLAPLILEALSQWLLSRIPGLLEGNPAKDSAGLPVRVPFPFQAIMKLLLLSFTSGLVLYSIPNLARLLQHPLKAEGMMAGLLGVCGVSITIPLVFRSLLDSSSWRMAKSFGLIVLLLLLTAVAMMNYSLAIFLVLALLLPAVLAQPRGASGKLPQLLRMAAALLFSPPFCLFYFCTAYSSLFRPADTPLDTAAAGANMTFAGIVFAYNSWHFVGSWIYALVCLSVWPLWLVSWTLCCQNIQKSPDTNAGTSHLHSD